MSARPPVVDLSRLTELQDDELERARAVVYASLAPRPLAFVEQKVAGKGTVEAAREAGYKSAERKGFKLLKQRGVAEAVAIGREIANRRAGITLEDVRFRFNALYRAAVMAGDLTTACRSTEQLARLAGLYPDQKVRLEVTRGPDLADVSEEEWELLARLRHEVRRALPAAQDGEPDHLEEDSDA